jgi:hypothetical protein
MKEKPILFSTPMVKALMEGRKTQTRRVVKPQPIIDIESGRVFTGHVPAKRSPYDINNWREPFAEQYCPYGQPGDLLWVREAFMPPLSYGTVTGYLFKADYEGLKEAKWKPSIHMPKGAARIRLRITEVRVERLKDITEEDTLAEGVASKGPSYNSKWEENYPIRFKDYKNPCDMYIFRYGIESFASLWQSINGPESWESNPFVWVVKFEVVSTTGKEGIK